ncbi:MAG: hypothetical protein MUF49_00730 [Oculatellaceae cyanobacterium Prado106]|jgi:hypothetical protein|nr:hypothetical protein [Oculatellaceae cyanobacterium Prado106]
MTPLLAPIQSDTFRKVFDLKIRADDYAEETGYTLNRKFLNLPQYRGELDRLLELRDRIEEVLPYVDLSSETSRREVLISRIVLELVHYTKAQLRIEYPLKVTEQLQGYLDYLLRTQTHLIVIEAKRQDLDYGFTQLIAKMIALDQWDRSPAQPTLLGAITTGTLWQFGLLDRQSRHIDQGLESYRAPEDLNDLMRILVAALSPLDH